MFKRLVRFLWFVPVVAGLLACSSATPVTDTPTLKPSATPVKVATPTKRSESTPSAEPTRAWQIEEVRDSDWTKGPADTDVVIVEYSDFQ